MTDDHCMSLYEVADLLGYTTETVIILIDYGVGAKATQIGPKPFCRAEVAHYQHGAPKSPNELLPMPAEYGSMFVKHDDGRWWPRLSHEEAVQAGEARYFNGGTCALGHCAERFTKSQECVICYKTRGKIVRQQLRRARSVNNPGCNPTKRPAY